MLYYTQSSTYLSFPLTAGTVIRARAARLRAKLARLLLFSSSLPLSLFLFPSSLFPCPSSHSSSPLPSSLFSHPPSLIPYSFTFFPSCDSPHPSWPPTKQLCPMTNTSTMKTVPWLSVANAFPRPWAKGSLVLCDPRHTLPPGLR